MNNLPLATLFGSASRCARLGLILAFVVAVPVAADQDLAWTAKDRCDAQLTYQIGRDAGGSVPDSGIDYRQARVTQLSSTKTGVAGSGLYRRDRFDRGRPYDYKCTFNVRTGAATASYRWTGNAHLPDDNSWPGGNNNMPQGRVVYSGGVTSVASGKALDVSGGSNYNGANVIQYTFRNLPNQLWDVIDAGRGRFVFVSQDSNKVLEVTGGSDSDGENVQQNRYNGNDGQLWRIERLGGGAFQVVNVGSGKCLDVEGGRKDDGANVIQYKCISRDNQAWRLGQ